jgi:hypothetical protein
MAEATSVVVGTNFFIVLLFPDLLYPLYKDLTSWVVKSDKKFNPTWKLASLALVSSMKATLSAKTANL